MGVPINVAAEIAVLDGRIEALENMIVEHAEKIDTVFIMTANAEEDVEAISDDLTASGADDFLGLTATDRVTGFTGVVTGQVRYISGCNQCLVVPKVGNDGKLVAGEWFDQQRLDVNARCERIVLDNGSTPGCDAAPPVR